MLLGLKFQAMTKEERKSAQQELKLSAKELKELLSLPLSNEVIFNICIRYIQVHPRNRKFKRKFLHLCSLQNVPYTLVANYNFFNYTQVKLKYLKLKYPHKNIYFKSNLRVYFGIRRYSLLKLQPKRDFPRLKEYLMK